MCSGVSRGLHLPLLLEIVLLCAKGTKQERSVNMQTISRQSNNVLRTVISILLAFVLMVGQMPALAYADTTNEQAVTQQEDTAATSSSETDSSDNSSPDDTGDSSAGATEESESTSTSDDSSEQTSTESKGSSVNNTNALNSEENLTVLENTLSKSDDVSEKNG